MALLNRSYYTIESNSIFLNGQSSTTLYAVIVFLGRFTYKNLVNYKMVKHISTCITQIDKSHLKVTCYSTKQPRTYISKVNNRDIKGILISIRSCLRQ